MIKVLSLIDTGGAGGAETVFLQTVTRLNRTNFESVAAIGRDGWLANQLRDHRLSPEIVPARGSFNVRYLREILRVARDREADVIVAHLYGSAVYACLAGAILSVPIIVVIHGHTDVSTTDRLATIKALLLRRIPRKVVFVSDQLRDHLATRLRIPPSRCAVIPNGVDTDIFRPQRDQTLRAELGLATDTILVGAIGNVRPPKAYEVFLAAARTLVCSSRKFHFVIAGDHSNSLGRQLKSHARSLGIDAHVRFLGLRSDVPRILNNLDVFVLSSTTEGFSIACIEAMACGVPVVATRSGGPEHILKGDMGILVPTGNPIAIAQAVERIIGSSDLATVLAENALRRVHDDYSLSLMLTRYENLLIDTVRPLPR